MSKETRQTTEPKDSTPRRGCRRRLLTTACALIAVLIIVFLLGAWRLSRGPISLAFLESHLQWTIGAADQPMTLAVKGPLATWGGWRRPIDLRAGPVTLTDAKDRVVLELNDVSMGLAIWRLVRGTVAVTRVEVSSIHLRILRTADERFVIGFEPTEKQPKAPGSDIGQSIQERLHDFLTSPDPGSPLGDLTRIAVVDSRVTVDDRVLGLTWKVPDIDIQLTRREGGIDAKANATLDLESHSTEIDVHAAYARATERFQGSATVKGVEPAALAEGIPALSVLSAFDLPVDINVDADVSIAGVLHSLDVEADCTRGSVTGGLKRADDGTVLARAQLKEIHLWEFAHALKQLGAIRTPVNGTATATLSSEHRLETATAKLTSELGNVSGSIQIAEDGGFTANADLAKIHLWELAELLPDLGRIRFPVDGRVKLELTSDRSIHGANIRLTGGRGSIRVPEIQDQPIALTRLSLEASAGDGARRIELSDLTVDLDGLSIHAKATADRNTTTTRVVADASLSDFDVSRIDQYWPSLLAPKVLAWITTNITAGTVHNASAHVGVTMASDLSGGVHLDALRGGFGFKDLTVAYLAPMAPATGVTGTGSFTDQAFDFEVTGGGVRDISFESAKVRISPLAGHTRLAVEANKADGPVRTAMEMLAGPPLELIGGSLPQPDQFSGNAVSHLELGIPLSGADPKPLSVSGASHLNGVGLTGWVKGYDLTDGILDLDFELTRLDVSGTARINGVPATFEWRENLTGRPVPRTVAATATIDDDDRRALGVPPIPQIAGPIGLKIDLTGQQDGSMEIDLGADLLHTAIDVTQIGWGKSPGKKGNVTAKTTIGPDWAVDVKRFDIDAGDLQSTGAISLKPKLSGLSKLVLENLEYGDNQISGSLTVSDDGRWDIGVSGRKFDVGPLLAPSSSPKQSSADQSSGNDPPAPPRTLPAITFDGRIDELVSGSDHRFGRLTATCAYDGTEFENLDATVQISPDDALVVRIDPSETVGHDLHVTATNVGELLGALIPKSEFHGGALDITGHKTAADQPLTGHIRLEDFKVTSSDVLERLLQIASIGGALEGLEGKGLHFSKLASDFEYLDEQLKIAHFRTHGESIGLTADGSLDFTSSVFDLRGVVVPASRMQHLLGKIPGLGTILTGTKDTGLFSVNYEIKGSSDDPKITTNPLSVLTPGILRDLFHFHDDPKESKKKHKDN
jgi:hypothetical protein